MSIEYCYSDFFLRIENLEGFSQNAYKKKITTSDPDSRAARLFEDCFCNHVDFHDHTATKLTLNDSKGTRYINRDLLTSVFINRFYKPPVISCFESGSEKQFKDYVYEICEDSFTPSEDSENTKNCFRLGSNRVRYILGDIGTGKSAFVKKIICEIEQDRRSLDTEYTLLPIYMNLEELYNYETQPTPLKNSFLESLYKRIYEEVLGRDICSDNLHYINPSIDPNIAIKRLLLALKEAGIRIVLFIDNLDFYHYYYARYAIFDEYYDKQAESIHNNIIWLISVFNDEDKLGHLGLNVVFTARVYVFEEISNKYDGTQIDINSSEAVSLSLVSEEQIVASRLNLFSEAVDLITSRYPSKASQMEEGLLSLKINILNNDLSSGEHVSRSAINTIYKLGQHGYRSLVQFLSSLRIPYSKFELVERFFNHQSRSLHLLYINSMHRKYTQKQNHFPNMFLNDCTVIENSVFPDAHRPHVHSYWLKYFVLGYVSTQRSVSVGKVLDLFVEKGQYESHLVRHVIGSLCTANEFRCAELDPLDIDKPIRSKKIGITERGTEILRKERGVNYCFDFTYLRTIVSDHWLAFPIQLVEHMYVENQDFNHLFESGDKYRDATIHSVIEHAYQTIAFVRLLEISYRYEVLKAKPVLDKYLRELDLVPDFDSLVDAIVHNVERIHLRFSKAIPEETLTKLQNLSDSVKSNTELLQSLEAYYLRVRVHVDA